MGGGRVDILMYHSISAAAGPASIAPEVFAAQMQALAESGVPVISMDEFARGSRAPYTVAITFDDGYCDFAETAWPILRRHGFPALVYLPAALMGGAEDWPGCHHPPRRLMDWDTLRRLAAEGAEFGGHTLTHPDLARLPEAELEGEIAGAKQRIEAELGRPVRHFAPPYGSSSAAVRRIAARHYATSAGTRLGQAGPEAPRHDLPRIEMFYFTDPARWRARLAGRGGAYLARRKLLRGARQLALAPLSRLAGGRP
ncbi:polysaccharide deacetylase family protein (plasmid) [Roseobacteraceae bacterium NS-SX3]